MDTAAVIALLNEQRALQQSLASSWRESPGGWTEAQLFGHIAAWRSRQLACLRDGTQSPSHEDVNDAELAALRDADGPVEAARADALFGTLIDEVRERGADAAFGWHTARTLGEAVFRNSINHAAGHLIEHLFESGDIASAAPLAQRIVDSFRSLNVGPQLLGGPLYNLAAIRIRQDRLDEARALLVEAMHERPDLAAAAETDPDVAAIRDAITS
jgi:hypothetical protein